MTPYHRVSGPYPILQDRRVDARWLLVTLALSFLLGASASYASQPLRSERGHESGRILAEIPVHGTVKPGKAVATTPHFATVAPRGSRGSAP